MSTIKVLIVTHSEDNDSVKFVTEALARRGAEVVRLDTDRFPLELGLALSTAQGGETHILTTNCAHDLAGVGAVWYRRLRHPKGLEGLDPQIEQAAALESQATLLGLISTLDAFVLDSPHRVRYAEQKPLQLKLARALGLQVPHTLITNQPDEVRRFYQTCGGRMVTKMLSSFAIYEDGQEEVVFTTPVTPEHLEALEGLRYCPMVFQEMVPKALELRVTVVGERVFAASVDSQKLEATRFDWREDGAALMEAWRPYRLPAEVERKLLTLMDRLALNYGAADFILTPGGEHVFLEVNPAGEFFWLELCPGLPISDALADVLLGRAQRRGGRNPIDERVSIVT